MPKFIKRNVIGSDFIILLTIILHYYEAWIFSTTTSADGNIPMSALLFISGGFRWVACIILLTAATSAFIGEFVAMFKRYRFLFLSLQILLLFVTSLSALHYGIVEHYADETITHSHHFIISDQFWRIIAPVAYAICVSARVKNGAA